MPLIKKRVLADYYAARPLKGNQIYIVPQSQPDATGFSGNEPVRVDVNPMEPNQDSMPDQSSPDVPLPLTTSGASTAPVVHHVGASLVRDSE